MQETKHWIQFAADTAAAALDCVHQQWAAIVLRTRAVVIKTKRELSMGGLTLRIKLIIIK